nr:TIGR01906 family membrane protein [Psychromicrobium silvestre]
MAKELKEHQSSASNEPAFGWMAAASPTAKSNEKPAVPAEKAAKPAEKAEEKVGQPKPEALQKAPLAAQKDVPTETTMLAIRPPEEEVGRRAAEREQAAKVRPLAPRIWQVLVAVFFPIVLLTLAIRAIATPAFLWIEYNRPGFPVDTFGFGVEDRVTFGSYAVDYLNNFTAPRFLGDLVGGDGTTKLFQPGEVSHMADVKGVYQISMLIGLVLLVLMIIGMFYLSRRSVGGVRRALFAGSIATLVIIIGIAVFALLGWERFFTDFHELFFANGTWTFQLSDTLIRLFPEQFWTDSAAVIGVLVLLAASLTFAFSWPTRRRRELAAKAGRPSQGRRAAA